MTTQLAFWDTAPAAVLDPHQVAGPRSGPMAKASPAPASSPSPASEACGSSPSTTETPAARPNTQRPLSESSSAGVLDRLRKQLGNLESGRGENHDEPFAPVSSGVRSMDRLLPRDGFPAGSMVEWVATCAGGGARLLSMLAAAQALRACPGWLVVVDASGTFYPPAALGLGVPMDRIVWVRPADHQDQVWAIDQALRCPAVAAVWSPVGASLDDRDARRFQLAAETGNTLAMLVRPASVMNQPSFAAIRWRVQGEAPAGRASRGRTLRATLTRCRGGRIDRSVTFAITEHGIIDVPAHRSNTSVPRPAAHNTSAAAAVHLAAQLARPAVASRGSGKLAPVRQPAARQPAAQQTRASA
ncbi:ImuA family protein [Roseimaritima sediminicola]|uniref:ImuA family protein n=1 Tax=Roseimaritima sediminicola TaxID=2662066 RepID=UPI00129832B1|nr:hypothetical protein [Roseimaritima sediminicola]